jgi:hypothetical protein
MHFEVGKALGENKIKNKNTRCQWFTPVIVATQDA